MRTAIITVSSSVSRHEREDESGPLLAKLAEEAGCDIAAMDVLPDDVSLIEDRSHHYVEDSFELFFTTGGTGPTPDAVTPQAPATVRDWKRKSLSASP